MEGETEVALSSTATQAELAGEHGPIESGGDLNKIEKLRDSADSSSDDEDTTWPRSKKRSQHILDSDSEQEETAKSMVQIIDPKQKDNSSDSEGSSCERGERKAEEQRLAAKYKSLLDSDTESESGDAARQHESDNEVASGNGSSDEMPEKQAKRTEVPKRMSAKQAMEQMMAIKSETQRLHRENYVTIPYHQPKQFSLKEFMNRKTISKPSDLRDPQKRFSLKMSQEELQEFAKQLEEREKEANDFFKSEAETSKDINVGPAEIGCTDSDTEKNIELNNVTDESNKLHRIGSGADRNIQEEMFTVVQVGIVESQDEVVPRTQEDIIVMRTQESQMQDNDSVVNDSQFSKVFATQQSEEEDVSGTYESVTIPETEESLQLDPEGNDTAVPSKASESEVNMSAIGAMPEVLKDCNAIESPTLKGSPDMLIDLETGDVIPPEPTGPDKLLQRFLKHATKRKPKEATSVSIVSTENGKIEITSVNVALHEEQVNDQKPGAGYLKLKDDLMKVIMKRRKEEFQKRTDESKGSDKEHKKDFESEVNDAEAEEYFIDENEEFINEAEDEVDEPTPPIEVDENEEIKDGNIDQDDVDAYADDEYDSEESDGSDTETDTDDELVEETKPIKTRIIQAFDDSDDESAKPDGVMNAADLGSETNGRLWQEVEEKRNLDEEDELLGLCSGRFDATQANSVMSQIPITQRLDAAAVDDTELLDLCSGTFQDGTQIPVASESKTANSPITAPNRLESSDEDDDSHIRIERTKKHKPIRKLGFSDDENEITQDEDENETIQDESENETVQDEEEVPETYIDYDSEENEIEVQLTKNDRREKAAEFVDNEAELSESEWGSADENEKDLDHYEIDLADEEQFDRAKLQSELGKIHMRRVLDDDIREVKRLQEMLIEDEETDGVGRQRKFRWQFMDDGFDLGVRKDFEGEHLDVDGEDELTWRKMRYEREMLLEQNAAKLNVEEPRLKTNLTCTSGKKITIVSMNAEATTVAEASSPFLIAKTMNLSRGSFLMRDNATLSKLANITRASGDQEAGAARAGKAQNFVFAAINTPDQENSLKRKLASKEQETSLSQKRKKKKFRLIDQLA